jgi:hypothetical protein
MDAAAGWNEMERDEAEGVGESDRMKRSYRPEHHSGNPFLCHLTILVAQWLRMARLPSFLAPRAGDLLRAVTIYEGW